MGGVTVFNNIKETFTRRFANWKISISDDDLYVGNKVSIPTKEWKLKWIMQTNERGTYIEYYGVHNRNQHLHGRIYDDGAEEALDVLKEYIMYSPNTPGAREKSAKDLDMYNSMLMNDLKKKGLI